MHRPKVFRVTLDKYVVADSNTDALVQCSIEEAEVECVRDMVTTERLIQTVLEWEDPYDSDALGMSDDEPLIDALETYIKKRGYEVKR